MNVSEETWLKVGNHPYTLSPAQKQKEILIATLRNTLGDILLDAKIEFDRRNDSENTQ